MNAEQMARQVSEARTSQIALPLVIFQYANWCPHCHHSAPTFAALATAHHNIARFVAIDCAGSGAAFCRGEFYVHGFPTVRLVHQHVTKELDRLVVLNKNNNFEKFPSVLPFAPGQPVPETVPGVPPALQAPRAFAPAAESARTQERSHSESQSAPAASAAERDQSELHGSQERKESAQRQPSRWASEEFAEVSAETRRWDAEAVVVELLRQVAPETATYPEIPTERLETMRKLLELLSTTFPRLGMRRDARAALEAVQTRETMNADEWVAILDVLDSFKAEKLSYRHCKQYSCGLWQLFHILSVSAEREFEDERNPTGRARSARASEVMDATRFIVDHFFKCEECHREFLHMFDQKLLDRPVANVTREKVVMWLWRVHNAVTARLSMAKTPPVNPVWPTQLATSKALRLSEAAQAQVARTSVMTSYWADAWLFERSSKSYGGLGRHHSSTGYEADDPSSKPAETTLDSSSLSPPAVAAIAVLSVSVFALFLGAVYRGIQRLKSQTPVQAAYQQEHEFVTVQTRKHL